MTFATWLTVITICALGAMSPGPSLALVLRQTLAGGRRNGMVAAISHGVGIGLYAFLSIIGLAAVITASPALFSMLQWAGAAYLLWLGLKGITARRSATGDLPAVPTTASAARDGFMLAFLNPKVAVFFIALFSQVVGPQTTLLAKFGYAATAMVIDMGWYLIVAWLFSNPRLLATLKRNVIWLERFFGVLLIALAGRLVAGMITA